MELNRGARVASGLSSKPIASEKPCGHEQAEAVKVSSALQPRCAGGAAPRPAALLSMALRVLQTAQISSKSTANLGKWGSPARRVAASSR